MSVEGAVLQGLVNKTTSESDRDILISINNELVKLNAFDPRPKIMLKTPKTTTLNVNQTANTVLLNSPIVPHNHVFTVKDFTVSFRTAGGTVKLVALDSQNAIMDDILVDISASGSGAGGTVFEAGEALGVVVQTQGAGTITVRCSGDLKRIRL